MTDTLVWLKTSWPQEKRGWDAAYWEPSAETTLTRVMSPTQVQDPTGAEAMAEGDSSSMETPSSEGKVHGLPEVPGSPEDYPLDKDFSMVAEGTQMKEGSDLANPCKVEMNLVEGGIHTEDLVDQAEVDCQIRVETATTEINMDLVEGGIHTGGPGGQPNGAEENEWHPHWVECIRTVDYRR